MATAAYAECPTDNRRETMERANRVLLAAEAKKYLNSGPFGAWIRMRDAINADGLVRGRIVPRFDPRLFPFPPPNRGRAVFPHKYAEESRRVKVGFDNEAYIDRDGDIVIRDTTDDEIRLYMKPKAVKKLKKLIRQMEEGA